MHVQLHTYTWCSTASAGHHLLCPHTHQIKDVFEPNQLNQVACNSISYGGPYFHTLCVSRSLKM